MIVNHHFSPPFGEYFLKFPTTFSIEVKKVPSGEGVGKEHNSVFFAELFFLGDGGVDLRGLVLCFFLLFSWWLVDICLDAIG